MTIRAQQRPTIDVLASIKTAVQSKSLSTFGTDAATKHSMSLMYIAMAAFESGHINEAVWYAEQEASFNYREFGPGHPWTRSSILCLTALSRCLEFSGVECP